MISFEMKSLIFRGVAGFDSFTCRNFIHGGSSPGMFPCFINKEESILNDASSKIILNMTILVYYIEVKPYLSVSSVTFLLFSATDLFNFGGYVVPLHVSDKSSHGCHAFMLI